MFKHLAGFVIFSFIVGTSAFISGLFYEIPSSDSVFVKDQPIRVFSKRSCRKYKKKYKAGKLTDLKLKQAVFNLKTKQLDTSFVMKRKSEYTNRVSIGLHFFAKDADGTRYLATEKVNLNPVFDDYGIAEQDAVSYFLWLDDLQNYENLYVVPEANYSKRDYLQNKFSIPDFDEADAFSVITIGKNLD